MQILKTNKIMCVAHIAFLLDSTERIKIYSVLNLNLLLGVNFRAIYFKFTYIFLLSPCSFPFPHCSPMTRNSDNVTHSVLMGVERHSSNTEKTVSFATVLSSIYIPTID